MADCQEGSERRGKILVLAVGNTLVGDDGAGAACLELMAPRWSGAPNVDMVDGGTLGLYLIDRVAGYEKVLFLDAVALPEPPGTIIAALDGEVEAVFRTRFSPHQAGVNDLLSALALMGRRPANVALVGVVPETIDYGIGLSTTVEAALPRMAASASEVIAGWGGAGRS